MMLSRRLALIIALLTAAAATADTLSIERIFSDPPLASSSLRAPRLAPDGSRVTFLRASASEPKRLDLWEYRIDTGQTRLMVDSRRLIGDESQDNGAETGAHSQARGISSYRWSPDGTKILFPLGGIVYLYDLSAKPGRQVRQITGSGSEAVDAQVSPGGRYVSFVSHQNLWVFDLRTGEGRQLTADGGGNIHNGEAEIVAQTEMNRAGGYWWAPDDSAIAFERYDEAAVPLAKRARIQPEYTELIRQHAPSPGDRNVEIKLGVVAPDGGKPRWIDLGKDSDIYLARVNWLPDGRHLAYQRQSRNQRRLDLVLADPRNREQRVLLSETSRTWVQLNDDLRFFADQTQFLWTSDRSGYKQLYLYGLDGKLRKTLSSGAWEIDRILALDEIGDKICFSANKDYALDQQIYTISLTGNDKMQRISARDGWHEALFAESASVYLDSFSDPTTPPQVSVNRADGSVISVLDNLSPDTESPYAAFENEHRTPDFGILKTAEGQDLYYRMYRPPAMQADKRYPVLVRFYGGPGRQLVNRSFGDLFDQYMAQRGYIVFSLDNRGTPRRGRAFEDVIFGQLGKFEVTDQLSGIAWLKTQSYVDAERIGIFGWSYGGYLALMLLAKASDQIAAGVAVAPVTDWRMYDSHFSERYLDTPANNPQGYIASSVLPLATGIHSPLLLIHGMADDNVLFTHSTRLMAVLQERGQQFEMMTYPGGNHALSTPEQQRHVYTAIATFFDTHLKPRN
jgi:dipeptidyl-peptidase 4